GRVEHRSFLSWVHSLNCKKWVIRTKKLLKREIITRFSALLRQLGVTSILVCDTTSPNALSRTGVEEFVTQGLILLGLDMVNDKINRNLLIWKMRSTAHSMKKHTFVISENGIKFSK
ncbi:MAG: ATPase domain-containing protein, partial [Candidatus Thorarchaeota archaeon]